MSFALTPVPVLGVLSTVKNILNLLKSVFGFITNIISGIAWLISELPVWTAGVAESIGFAPTFLAGFLTVCLSITVLFAVLKLI